MTPTPMPLTFQWLVPTLLGGIAVLLGVIGFFCGIYLMDIKEKFVSLDAKMAESNNKNEKILLQLTERVFNHARQLAVLEDRQDRPLLNKTQNDR